MVLRIAEVESNVVLSMMACLQEMGLHLAEIRTKGQLSKGSGRRFIRGHVFCGKGANAGETKQAQPPPPCRLNAANQMKPTGLSAHLEFECLY